MNQSMLINRIGSPQVSPLRVALFSCGLGNINRGFEISTGRFFQAIANDADFDVRLYCGGDYRGGAPVWNIGRDVWLRYGVRSFPGMDDVQRWKLAYVLEQVSFSFGLLAQSGKWQPDIVWTKEVPLGHILYYFRQLTGLKYRIVFSDGGGFKPKTYAQFDFLHHLQPGAYEDSLAFGIPPEKMCVIPNLVPLRSTNKSRSELRQEYGFEPDDYVVVCLAAWNKHHKRIDYLIQEVARLCDPRVKLLLCGQPEPEGDLLRPMAEALLPGRVKWLTVPEDKVVEILKLSDLFVLTSLFEGLGAVIIEAAMFGLPIICHPHSGGKFILQSDRWLRDLSLDGALAAGIQEMRTSPPSAAQLAALKEDVTNRFSEQKTTAAFKSMLLQVHNQPQPVRKPTPVT